MSNGWCCRPPWAEVEATPHGPNRDALNQLCRRVRTICDQLVDAFDVPAELLRAEIIA